VSETIAIRTERLKALREQHGWSQRELSRLCGLGETAIGSYERGDVDPTAKQLKKIAGTLDVSVDYLLGRADEPTARFGSSEINDDERAIVQALRRDGWLGALRVVTDHLTSQAT
jgi:transcriptional regulator with XRE-family HTH domain